MFGYEIMRFPRRLGHLNSFIHFPQGLEPFKLVHLENGITFGTLLYNEAHILGFKNQSQLRRGQVLVSLIFKTTTNSVISKRNGN